MLSSDQSEDPGIPIQPLPSASVEFTPRKLTEYVPLSELQAHGLTSDLPLTSPLPSSLFYPSHGSLWEAADPLSIPHQQESTWGWTVSIASLATSPAWEVGERA